MYYILVCIQPLKLSLNFGSNESVDWTCPTNNKKYQIEERKKNQGEKGSRADRQLQYSMIGSLLVSEGWSQ